MHERLEDLLTSNVFGALRYLPDGNVVVQLLGDAVRQDGSHRTLQKDVEEGLDWLTLSEGGKIATCVSFWPHLSRSEPDVLYEWIGERNHFWLMIEVKYLSGKSGTGWSEEDDEVPALSDQLAREYLDLSDRIRHGDHGALVYLTVHPVAPEPDIHETLESIERMSPPGPPYIYWTNWQSIYRNLRKLDDPSVRLPNERRVISDIQHLLEHKGLTGLLPWASAIVVPDAGDGPMWYSAAHIASNYEWAEIADSPALAWYVTGTRLSHYDWSEKFGGSPTTWYRHS